MIEQEKTSIIRTNIEKLGEFVYYMIRDILMYYFDKVRIIEDILIEIKEKEQYIN